MRNCGIVDNFCGIVDNFFSVPFFSESYPHIKGFYLWITPLYLWITRPFSVDKSWSRPILDVMTAFRGLWISRGHDSFYITLLLKAFKGFKPPLKFFLKKFSLKFLVFKSIC